MKLQFIIRRTMICILMIALLFIVQTSIFSHLELAGVVPNLLLAFTALVGFMRGRKEGMLVGLFAGFILDSFSSQLFGIYAFTFLFLGFLNGFLRKLFFGDDIKLPVLFVGFTDLVYGFVVYLVSFALRGRTDFKFYFMNIMLPEAVYTVLVSFVLYFILNWIVVRVDKEEKKGERRF